MHGSIRQVWLFGVIAVWLVLDDLVYDDLEERRELVSFVLLLLELIEKSSECLRPALIHLDHLGLHVKQHIVDIVKVLFCECLQDEKTARIIQDHALITLESKITDSLQKLDLVHLLLRMNLTVSLPIARLELFLGRVLVFLLLSVDLFLRDSTKMSH